MNNGSKLCWRKAVGGGGEGVGVVSLLQSWQLPSALGLSSLAFKLYSLERGFYFFSHWETLLTRVGLVAPSPRGFPSYPQYSGVI